MECFRRVEANGERTALAAYCAPHPIPDNWREVIIFPGVDGHALRFGQENANRALSGLLKLVAPSIPDTVHVGGITYPENDAETFLHEQLLPRLGLTEEAKPPFTTLQKRMSQLTFISHSYGADFGQNLAHLFAKKLAKRGYTDTQVSDICHAGVLIAVAGATKFDTGETQFTTLHFRGSNDPIPVGTRLKNNSSTEIARDYGYGGAHAFSCRLLNHGALVSTPLEGIADEKLTQLQTEFADAQPDFPQIFDARHVPKAHWEVHGELSNALYVKLKNQAVANAVNRGPGVARPRALLTDGGQLSNPEKQSLTTLLPSTLAYAAG